MLRQGGILLIKIKASKIAKAKRIETAWLLGLLH
ncbi:hypothetical protein N475_18725 [Pseudoalteromonas luteoviolacea DSM 6061]|uniref:Uncharacterized protein n=1 Tax=Pseudoalteromonas luteoviolacea DSM 6061 TaxID=1365250 RepID=A0A166W3R4_9GAMM|nr:hypothetical protein N475_18725 [Pseudoalteromonas luteoviolacea DSM 6061]MBE0387624.1 biosynthetic protein [Pseudoalteromonas luteoviolacea DSM 6061]